YLYATDARTQQSHHWFRLPRRTRDADLTTLPVLPFPFALDLSGTQVTGAALATLADQPNLVVLDVCDTQVTDAGLPALTGCRKLATLHLDRKLLTDAGLRALRESGLLHRIGFAKTRGGTPAGAPADVASLDLSFTPITDAGLKEIRDMSGLATLDLRSTAVT